MLGTIWIMLSIEAAAAFTLAATAAAWAQHSLGDHRPACTPKRARPARTPRRQTGLRTSGTRPSNATSAVRDGR